MDRREYCVISYIVRDANNFAVAFVYFANEAGRRAAAGLMTKDEARKVAAGIAAGAAEAAGVLAAPHLRGWRSFANQR